MKKYLILLFVLCAPISMMLAQSQKQITYSFDKGWQVSEFDLAQTYTVQMTDYEALSITDQFERIKKMESDLVHFNFDENDQKVTMRLDLEKRPNWTSDNWFVYLKRRAIMAK